MHDRATQALAKLALEPEWEAKFEPNSYGFRPGRSAHDAIEAIFLNIKQCKTRIGNTMLNPIILGRVIN
jgi:RNA-directed DNA polymerase